MERWDKYNIGVRTKQARQEVAFPIKTSEVSGSASAGEIAAENLRGLDYSLKLTLWWAHVLRDKLRHIVIRGKMKAEQICSIAR